MRRGLNTDYDFVKAWCVGVLNTDYTDAFSVWGHGYLFKAWCVGVLNTDFTDNTGILLEDVKTGGFGPIVRKHKTIRDIRVIRVQ